MNPESMVHALEIVRDLLATGGLLIDVHPSSDPPPILASCDGRETSAGWLQESDDFVEYTLASQALQHAEQQSWFQKETQGEFTFTIHAESVEEMIDFLAKEWKDAVFPVESAEKIRQLYQEPCLKKEIIIAERILIARYRQAWKEPAKA
jgi:hypothetical protein